jgi:hypothetical protein
MEGRAMMRKSSRFTVAVATIGLALVASSGAQAFTLRTPSLVPDPDKVPGDPSTGGYLYCQVKVTSKTPIGITAKIISETGTDVTEFGSGFRASPGVMIPDRFYAEETSGSFKDNARYCKVSITGAYRRDVQTLSLTAYDAKGDPIATVEAQ